MGYFSELDFMQREDTAWSNPTKVQQLTDKMHCLNEQLIDLESQCPHNVSPVFDRMFYSECLAGMCDDENTMQGVLQTIRKTEDLLHIAQVEEQRAFEETKRRTDWRTALLETGATPDHQIVLLDVFFPAAAA